MKWLLIYLAVLNIFAAVICFADKLAAKKRMWRMSEKTLFTLCVLGGSAGMYITMLLIRHKTKHKRFMIGIPIIIALQCVLISYLLTNGCL